MLMVSYGSCASAQGKCPLPGTFLLNTLRPAPVRHRCSPKMDDRHGSDQHSASTHSCQHSDDSSEEGSFEKDASRTAEAVVILSHMLASRKLGAAAWRPNDTRMQGFES